MQAADRSVLVEHEQRTLIAHELLRADDLPDVFGHDERLVVEDRRFCIGPVEHVDLTVRHHILGSARSIKCRRDFHIRSISHINAAVDR